MFDSLTTSFPHVQPILDADKAAVAGREVYDDGYFELLFAEGEADSRATGFGDSIMAVASVITTRGSRPGRPALPLEEAREPRKVRRQ